MRFKTRKIAIIGVGHVGSHCAFTLASQGLCEEIAMIDINQPKAQAQAIDLMDASIYLSHYVKTYAGSYEDLIEADICVICAAPPASAGQPRFEQALQTTKVMDQIIPHIRKSGFSGILINVSNPCDVITRYLFERLDLPASQVIGTGTSLDTARLKRVLSAELNLDCHSIQAYVLGEHGESQMVPWTNVGLAGKPLFDLMREDPEQYGRIDLSYIAERARHTCPVIRDGKGATEFGIGAAVAEIVRVIFHNEHRALAVSALLEGQYGQHGVYAGVPAVIGKDGVELVVEIPMSQAEQSDFRASCNAIRSFYEQAKEV